MLTELQQKDIKALKEECKAMEENGYSAFDICCYLNDYIYDLSETVSNEYYKAVYSLEEYYHNQIR